jgi:hypothetical protein
MKLEYIAYRATLSAGMKENSKVDGADPIIGRQ